MAQADPHQRGPVGDARRASSTTPRSSSSTSSAAATTASPATSTRARWCACCPGMQAAFVDIGLEKAAFLHVVRPRRRPGSRPRARRPRSRSRTSTRPAKETRPPRLRAAARHRCRRSRSACRRARSSSCRWRRSRSAPRARASPRISRCPAATSCYMPGTRHIGISRRIEDRKSATACARSSRPSARPTAASSSAPRARARRSARSTTTSASSPACGRASGKTADTATAPALIHQDLDLVLRTVRDLFTGDVERLIVDAPADHARVLEFVEAIMPRTGGARAPLPGRDADLRAARHRDARSTARSIAGCGSSPAATSSSTRPSR